MTIFDNAPRKVLTRVAGALEHYVRSEKLGTIDKEMGAIRLIAGEEELVVAIFEWLKLNADKCSHASCVAGCDRIRGSAEIAFPIERVQGPAHGEHIGEHGFLACAWAGVVEPQECSRRSPAPAADPLSRPAGCFEQVGDVDAFGRDAPP